MSVVKTGLRHYLHIVVVIVGAGPVGLLLANLLGLRGIRTTVLERSVSIPPGSRAIGVMPPSLEILNEAGLVAPFLTAGRTVRRAVVHGTGGAPLGTLQFARVHPDFPYVLAIPQVATLEILEANLTKYPCVTVQRGSDVVGVESDRSGPVQVTIAGGGTVTGNFCVVAAGVRSGAVAGVEIPRRGGNYNRHFLMADFEDESGLGDDAHLWFTRSGAVESFPLPGGRRRWIVQLDSGTPNGQSTPALTRLVHQRSGYDLTGAAPLWESSFSPSWSLADRFHRDGQIFLAGDAAHTMSPIGGQGMNTGFADARHLAAVLEGSHGNSGAAADREAVARYQRFRQRAATIATGRAAAGMAVGTLTGPVASALRSGVIAAALNSPLRGSLARHFAMITIPRFAS